MVKSFLMLQKMKKELKVKDLSIVILHAPNRVSFLQFHKLPKISPLFLYGSCWKLIFLELTLRCIGKARVQWAESDFSRNSKIFSKEEIYLDQFIPLNSKIRESGSDITISQFPSDLWPHLHFYPETGILSLPRKLHTFPFNFQLPLGLPSTFESVYGFIIYALEARIVVQHKKRESFTLDARLEFPVNDLLDLNDYPENSQPITIEKFKSVWCLCCGSGPVGFRINLPRTGFVAGEEIPNVTEMVNHSRMETLDVRVILVRVRFESTCYL